MLSSLVGQQSSDLSIGNHSKRFVNRRVNISMLCVYHCLVAKPTPRASFLPSFQSTVKHI
jgi:hypothetical protein